MAADDTAVLPEVDRSTRALYRAIEALEILELLERPTASTVSLTQDGRKLAGARLDLDAFPSEHVQRLGDWGVERDIEDLLTEQRRAPNNTITHVEVKNWRQFEFASIDMHPRLTILTGANAAGKTTLLNLLAPHFSWNAQLLSPRYRPSDSNYSNPPAFGSIRYSNGAISPISRPATYSPDTPGFESVPVFIPQQQGVPGIFISSHRSLSSYQPLEQLPARFSQSSVLLQQYAAEVQSRYSGGSSQHSPLYRMKEALVSAAMHGYGNAAMEANEEARSVWEGFSDILRLFLPKSISYVSLSVRDADVLVRTRDGEFPLEAVSGGVSAMIELAWQIFLRARDSDAFTVCLDEPENHLHPELQREIIPTLLDAFPNVSFIVATHSPFVVTASRDCYIYSLRKNDKGKVVSQKIIDANASATPDETLMSILGLDSPLGIWAQDELSNALRQVPIDPSAQDLRSLRDRLRKLGLDKQFPAALDALEPGRN
ncbi:AAA domain-containing protein [Frigoribacterium sp. PhB24]|nr:AAA domain-containing protein [Frigoribacterium sp. PhB24]